MTQTNDPTDDNLADPNAGEQDLTPSVDEQNIVTEKAIEELSPEQVDYKEKAAQSFKEAMKQKQEKEQLATENLYYKNMAEVAKDSSKLHDIARSNPAMADRIAKEYGYGETYAQAVSTSDTTETPAAQIDPKQAAREVYQENEQVKQKKSIEDYEVQFFIDNKIAMGSPKYTQIMNTYSRYPSGTLKDAQDLLIMAHTRHNPTVEVELPSPNGDFGSRGKVKSEFTDSDKKIMTENGWDAKKLREFKTSEMASW